MEESLFFVAEISANHNGSLSRAKSLVEAAAASGANAVKFQTYKPETMTLDTNTFSVSEGHSLWGGIKLFDLYKEAMTPWDWHEELFGLAAELGLIPFSSPFDRTAVDFLESLNCQIYKIASLEIGDLDLIQYVAETKKPIIMSTGASTLEEIQVAVDTARNAGCEDLTILLCTSAYPTPLTDVHLKRIETLSTKFQSPIGLSDHTAGISASLGAIALGARVIERHLTISRADGGLDSEFSLEPAEFKEMVRHGKAIQLSIGNPEWCIQDSEQESRRLRRSMFVVQDVKAGEIATRANVRNLRPNFGGLAGDLNFVLGKQFKEDMQKGSGLHKGDLE